MRKSIIFVAAVCAALSFAGAAFASNTWIGTVFFPNFTGASGAVVHVTPTSGGFGGSCSDSPFNTTAGGGGGWSAFTSNACSNLHVYATYTSGCYTYTSPNYVFATNDGGTSTGDDIVLGSPTRWC